MRSIAFIVAVLFAASLTLAQTSQPIEQRENKLPHVEVDVPNQRVRVECEMLGIDAPLEFLCVRSGTNEHESVLRTAAKPSHIHFALIMIGLAAGEPVRYDEKEKKWLPAHGGAIEIDAEFVNRDGKKMTVPASSLMREIKSKRSMPNHPWIFAGSKVMEDGSYAADVTGYVVSVVNFELSLIDIPDLASNANETLLWQIDKDAAPTPGSKVTLIFTPSKRNPSTAPSSRASAPASDVAGDAPIDVPTIKIASSGKIELGDEEVSRDQLLTRLKKMQSERPLRVRIAAAEPNSDLSKQVTEEIRAAGIAIEPAKVAQSPTAVQDRLKQLEDQLEELRRKQAEIEEQIRHLRPN